MVEDKTTKQQNNSSVLSVTLPGWSNIGEDGQMMFLGEEESMIKNAWVWTDGNYPDSLGNKYLFICVNLKC